MTLVTRVTYWLHEFFSASFCFRVRYPKGARVCYCRRIPNFRFLIRRCWIWHNRRCPISSFVYYHRSVNWCWWQVWDNSDVRWWQVWDIGDECWRRNILVTSLRYWWRVLETKYFGDKFEILTMGINFCASIILYDLYTMSHIVWKSILCSDFIMTSVSPSAHR